MKIVENVDKSHTCDCDYILAVKTEYAFCYDNVQTDSCQGLARIHNVPSTHSCSFSYCTGFACNKFPTAAGCPQDGALNRG